MAETLEQLIVDINADTKGFEKGLDNVEKGTKGISSGLTKLGGVVAGAFATAKIIDFTKATVMLASDADELQNKFSVVFDGITDDTNAWIANYSGATARGIQQTKEFLTSLQDIQTGYGRSVEEAAQFSQTIVGVTNDLVSFSNVPVEQASAAIQSALAGNLDSVSSLGIALNVATIDNGKYAESIGKSWKEMTILEKQNATLNGILAQSANAVGQNVDNWQDYNFELGDAAKTSGGFANQTKLLQGTLQDLGAEFGARLLPIATAFVTFLNENLVPAFDSFSDFIDLAGDSISSFAKSFSSATSSLGIDFSTIQDGLKVLGEFFVSVFEQIRTTVMNFIMENQESLNLFIETLKTLFTNTFIFLQELFIASFEVLKFLWDTFGQDILNIIILFIEVIVPIYTSLFETISSIFKIFADVFKGDWDSFWQDLADFITNITGLIIKTIKGMLRLIKETVGTLLGDFIDLGKSIINAMIDGIVEASKALARKAVEAVKNALSAAKNAISGGGSAGGIQGRAEASASGGGGGTRGRSSRNDNTSAGGNNVNVTINNNNNPSPSDIARQINKQSVAMGLNF